MATTTAIVVADPTKGIKVDAGIIAQPFRDEIKERVSQLHKHGIGASAVLLDDVVRSDRCTIVPYDQ